MFLEQNFTQYAIFTVTVKTSLSVKLISSAAQRQEAHRLLGAALERVPGFEPTRTDRALPSDLGAAGWFEFRVNKVPYHFQYLVLSDGYPKRVRALIQELGNQSRPAHTQCSYTVLVAPWFSPDTIAICAGAGYGTLDFSGNYRLHCGSIFLERIGTPPPPAEQRRAASIFAAKSSRVLRAVLAVPEHVWKVTELIAITGVSAGLVSRVRQHLLEQQWIEERPGGVRLLAPEPLLSAWAQHWHPGQEQVWRGYTLLHGQALKARILKVMQGEHGGEDVLAAGVSAAQWMAPFMRDHREHFCVTPKGFDILREELDLESETLGENVVLRIVEDPDIFLDRIQPSAFTWTTSPAQAYLELMQDGERGEEAAEHLLRTYMLPVLRGERPAPTSPLRQQLQALRDSA